MQPFNLSRRPLLNALLLAVLLAGLGAVSVATMRGPDVKVVFAHDTNNLPQGGEFLPIFQFFTPQINISDTLDLSQRFESIYDEQDALQDIYLGNPRYTVPNLETTSILEQYGATGGFYAFNVTQAFSSTVRGAIDEGDAEYLSCLFLLQNELLPSNVLTPDTQFCDFDPDTEDFYEVTLAHATAIGSNAPSTAGEGVTDTIVAAIVRVPMSLNTGEYSQIPSVPLGGAGGHISLLFRTTDYKADFPSLDASVPGLAAVALPFHQREFDFHGNFPAINVNDAVQQISQQVLGTYPNASEINIPDPQLMYMVDDAAVPQLALEPELVFKGIEVTVEGQTIILRDLSLPATTGFGPDVSIIEPEDNSSYRQGELITFTGSITGGAAPYTYTWTLDDDTVLMTGTLTVSGTVSFATADLPPRSGKDVPGPTTVYLNVEDANGAQRHDYVSVLITAQPQLFLPAILAPANNSVTMPVLSTPQGANYSFGVESGSDYPPYGTGGADLPGVVPDAGGFRSGMQGLGWNQRFNWSNALAWERDWRDCSLGGGDCSYGVDRADFVYYAGHGAAGGLSLPSSVDSTWFGGENARFQNARWVGFASCQTLRAQWTPASEAPIRRWFNSFQGAHMLLGFNSNMADVAFGPRLVDNMRIPTFFFGLIELPWAQRTIADAWIQTAFQMDAGQPVYIFARGTNGVNPEGEKLPRASDPPRPRPFPVASWHWVWWNE